MSKHHKMFLVWLFVGSCCIAVNFSLSGLGIWFIGLAFYEAVLEIKNG